MYDRQHGCILYDSIDTNVFHGMKVVSSLRKILRTDDFSAMDKQPGGEGCSNCVLQ